MLEFTKYISSNSALKKSHLKHPMGFRYLVFNRVPEVELKASNI